MKTEAKIKQLDYKAVQKRSKHMDCTITEADFNTAHPNTNRIAYAVSDINRYLKHKGGGRI